MSDDRPEIDQEVVAAASDAEPLTVAGIAWARRHKRRFDRIITCQDPDLRPAKALAFHRQPAPAHLRLRFVDMDSAAPSPWDESPLFRLPERNDVERALSFAREPGRLLVHCTAGVGRSGGVALAIIADRLGPGLEAEAMAELLRIRDCAVPNLAVVRHADSILGRDGRLLDAVLKSDAERPQAGWRRIENRKAHFLHYGLPGDW